MKILCGQLNARCATCRRFDYRCSSHPQGTFALMLASLKTSIIWKFLNIFIVTCGHNVHGTLHWSQCSVAPIMILCKYS